MKKRTSLLSGILVVLIVVLLLFQTPLLSVARRTVWAAWVHTIGRVGRVGSLEVSNDVAAQLERLQTENIRLRAELVDYNRLRWQLGSPSFDSYQIVPAAVSGRPVDTFRAQYILNRGLNDGITLGAPVVVHGSTLIGFITGVDPTTATLQLLFHPDTSVTAEVIIESTEEETPPPAARGLVEGKQYTSVVLTTVPRDIQLAEHMPVVTVAQEAVIPPGLLIGTVNRIQSTESDAYQEAQLQLPYDPDSISAVAVLTPS